MTIICLMGATASGKTPLAIEIIKQYPCDIISVDSAMVYRGMDIGTAKPDAETLKIAPHRLIDIADPSEAYSAGRFRQDALREIETSLANQRIPLLVGGTMMYYRVLQQGLAELPTADAALRDQLQARIDQEGLPALYEELKSIDAAAASRIHENDAKRIMRALEVFMLTGKTMTQSQAESTDPLSQYRIYNFAIDVPDRAALHARIADRFHLMLKQGFLEEVEALYARGDLSTDLPSIRSVGYRQAFEYMAGSISKAEMVEKAIAATRQLAKRQLTWLRTWPGVITIKGHGSELLTNIDQYLSGICNA